MMHRRSGVSELMAAVLTIAITLVAGAALFGFVNGQAAASEQLIGQAAGVNANFLAEKFVIADLSFTQNTVNIWIYNNGAIDLQIAQVTVYDSTRGTCTTNCFYVSFTAGQPSSTCSVQSSAVSGFYLKQRSPVQEISLSLSPPPTGCGPYSFGNGDTYYVSVLGLWGNEVSSSMEYLS
jgi:flagellin-like protein